MLIMLAIGLSAVLLRLEYVRVSDVPLESDMADYFELARNVANGQGYISPDGHRAYLPPGYPLFMALFFKLLIPTAQAVRYFQAVIGAASCLLAFHLARLLGQRLTRNSSNRLERNLMGLAAPSAAGLAMAFYDTHIIYAGILMTETLFTFLLLLWIVALVKAWGHPQVRWTAVAGFLLGIMILIRPTSIFYSPLLLLASLSLGRHWRHRLHALAMAVGLMAVVILPWTLRNTVAFKRVVLVSTNGGVSFYLGHNPHFDYSSGEKRAIRTATDLDEIAENRMFYSVAWEYIRAHPGEDLRNSFTKLHHVYTMKIKPFPWDYSREFPTRDWRYPTLGWGLWLLISGGIGGVLCSLRDRRFVALIGGVIGLHTLHCMILFGRTRFRVPMEPLFLISCALGVGLLAVYVLRATHRMPSTADAEERP